ncbi:hypothetical protein D7V86_14820 [bacterium D16-51]|nr:hypothetical protein D7V96_02105 [bacterium D16-59]RKI58829.1 hypothetical protein D7V86_14820 [bacterium D16-51]
MEYSISSKKDNPNPKTARPTIVRNCYEYAGSARDSDLTCSYENLVVEYMLKWYNCIYEW